MTNICQAWTRVGRDTLQSRCSRKATVEIAVKDKRSKEQLTVHICGTHDRSLGLGKVIDIEDQHRRYREVYDPEWSKRP